MIEPEICVIMRSTSMSRCCVCHSLTSANSTLALMCVFAMHTWLGLGLGLGLAR